MSVDPLGNVLINDQILANPIANKKLTIHTNNAMLYSPNVDISTVLSGMPDGMVIANTSQNTADGRGASLIFQCSSGTAGAYGGASITGITVAPNKMDIAFQVETDNIADPSGNFNFLREAMRITNNRFVGIGTQTPTAKLHAFCQSNPNGSDVRFENLPNGTGNILVIDQNGYIFRSTQSALVQNSNIDLNEKNLQQDILIQKLEQEIDVLKTLIQSEKTQMNIGKSILYPNVPNPTNEETTIRWKLQSNTEAATCNIYDLNGKLMLTFEINTKEEDSKLISTNNWTKGQYVCVLLTNGIAQDSNIIVVN